MKILKNGMVTTVLISVLLLTVKYCGVLRHDILSAINQTYFTVVPVIFAFMIISKLMCKCGVSDTVGHIFEKPLNFIVGLSGEAAGIYVLSFLTSYPIGALMVCDSVKRGTINKKDGESLIAICNNTGPGFIFGIIGGIYWKSQIIAWIIYIGQIISSLICGYLFRVNAETNLSNNNEKSVKISDITDAVASSSISMIYLIGNIVFFSVVSMELCSVCTGSNILKLIILCITEFTEGCRFSAEIGGYIGIFFSGFAITFGGFSVLFQILGNCSENRIRLYRYVAYKFIQGLFCGILSVLGLYILTIVK